MEKYTSRNRSNLWGVQKLPENVSIPILYWVPNFIFVVHEMYKSVPKFRFCTYSFLVKYQHHIGSQVYLKCLDANFPHGVSILAPIMLLYYQSY